MMWPFRHRSTRIADLEREVALANARVESGKMFQYRAEDAERNLAKRLHDASEEAEERQAEIERLTAERDEALRSRASLQTNLDKCKRELEDALRVAALDPATAGIDGFDRRGVLRVQYATKTSAAAASYRWREAFDRDPELITDLVRIGRLFALAPRTFRNGVEVPETVDPYVLAEDRGRREAVLEILAHNLTMTELTNLTEASNAQ